MRRSGMQEQESKAKAVEKEDEREGRREERRGYRDIPHVDVSVLSQDPERLD